MTDASLSSDPMATPKTDAAAFISFKTGREYVPADFARAQERRIAELTVLLQRCVEPVTDMRDAAVEQHRVYHLFPERQKRYQAAVDLYGGLLADIQKATQP